MTPRGLFVATVGVSLLNGWISPALLPVAILVVPIWTPEFVPLSQAFLAYASSLIIAAATLLFAGVPAAVVERIRNQQESDGLSMGVWLAAAALLTLPGLPRLAAAF
jgi:hypothetical protein